MKKIIVKTQKEWDEIPKEFDGYIYIESPSNLRLIIAERKGFSVVAWGNSSVEARGNSSVVARGNSSVVARGNSSVEAWGNSSVVAWGNSSVEAWGNSSVEAWGNVQIAKYSNNTKLKIQGNARIVTTPVTIEEYCDFYGIDVKDGCAILYKSVRSDLSSFHNHGFKYKVGETSKETCDPDISDACSYGLHISHLAWAVDFGNSRDNNLKLIECSVPLDKIIVPHFTDGKVRTSELTVIREVPLEECGIYGKILAKKRG